MSKQHPHISSLPAAPTNLLRLWAKAIRAQRQRVQMHMRDFAYRLNISLDTLQRLERGEPSVQVGTYLNAMLVLGIMDTLCPAPTDTLMRSTQMRVRTKNTKNDDYF